MYACMYVCVCMCLCVRVQYTFAYIIAIERVHFALFGLEQRVLVLLRRVPAHSTAHAYSQSQALSRQSIEANTRRDVLRKRSAPEAYIHSGVLVEAAIDRREVM